MVCLNLPLVKGKWLFVNINIQLYISINARISQNKRHNLRFSSFESRKVKSLLLK